MRNSFRCILAAVAAVFVLTVQTVPAQAQQAAKRSITKIAGDVYRFQNKFHFSVFMVTPKGVIVTDPINAEAASWLKAEIAKRFNQPVKYVIYSHDHRDHIAGADAFADTALYVGHEKAKRTIVGEKRPAPPPDITFSDRMTIELGGKQVELIYVGKSHSDNTIVMRFPAERVLFAVDIVTVNRLPYKTLTDSYWPDWINALKVVEAQDFDILAPGHGKLGTKADVTAHRGYLQDLYDGVLSGARAGRSLDEIKASLTLEEYKGWGRYKEWRTMNIEGVYQRVQAQRRGN